MFITFEGIDGSGKSTQIEHLRKHLKAKGARVEIFRDPGGPRVSEKIREILLNPDYGDMDPVTELLLFSASRSQLVAERILPALEAGSVVIVDRFYDSTTAYQGYGRASIPLEEINHLNRIASHKRTPDLTIYMKIPLQEAQKRMPEYRDRMEQAGDPFFQKVIAGFDEMSIVKDRFFTVDAAQPPEQVQQRIWEHVQTHFPRRG